MNAPQFDRLPCLKPRTRVMGICFSIGIGLLIGLGAFLLWFWWSSNHSSAVPQTPPHAVVQSYLHIQPLDLKRLPASQAAISRLIAKTYAVHPDLIAPLVQEAYRIGPIYRLDPTLILAIAAIESNFHPYLQSSAGAQGLMQIMPYVHSDRFQKQGGRNAIFDPLVNLRIGAEILHDSIKLRGGSVEAGLAFYLGGMDVDPEIADGYLKRVLDFKKTLDEVSNHSQEKRS